MPLIEKRNLKKTYVVVCCVCVAVSVMVFFLWLLVFVVVCLFVCVCVCCVLLLVFVVVCLFVCSFVSRCCVVVVLLLFLFYCFVFVACYVFVLCCCLCLCLCLCCFFLCCCSFVIVIVLKPYERSSPKKEKSISMFWMPAIQLFTRGSYGSVPWRRTHGCATGALASSSFASTLSPKRRATKFQALASELNLVGSPTLRAFLSSLLRKFK